MARFVRIDSQIRADRLIRAHLVRGPEPNPFQIANRYVFFEPPFFVKEFPRFDRLISAKIGKKKANI